MTPTQELCIPEFIKRDVIVQSQTGSGKTLAYLIPVFNKILSLGHSEDENTTKKDSTTDSTSITRRTIQALIITPTRELCIQVGDITKSFNLDYTILIGGMPIEEDLQKLGTSQIVIATPGRLFEIITSNSKLFAKIKYLVIDECDKLFGFDFEAKVTKIIDLLPKSRITGLFSATIDDNVARLSQHALSNPTTLKVNENIPERLCIKYQIMSPREKLENLMNYLKDRKAIVFFATCNAVDFFYSLLHETHKLHKIHGKMDQKDRNKIYSSFEQEGGTLFCTDVAARGIDFKNIDIVIHFDVPKDYSNIIHRSGRTARNGLSGDSIIFLMPNEKALIDFLKLKGLTVEEYNSPSTVDSNCYEKLKAGMNKELLESAVKAFVSYIRAYKEHILNYILNYKELDFDGLAELFFLERIPTMVELKNVKFKSFSRPEPSENPEKKPKKRKFTRKH